MTNEDTITATAPARQKARVMRGRKGGAAIAALTAYDYPTARLLDEAGIDVLLVGDSLGMVVLGHDDTTSVTMPMMLHHTAAVRRGTMRALLVADLPAGSYDSVEAAIRNAQELAAAGADAVKLEGGRDILPQIEGILAHGIPVVGHLGMLPQKVREEGGYRKKGKTNDEIAALVNDARALDAAGVTMLVLESITATCADAITPVVSCPTIGIGAGLHTDGQIRVIHDLIGTYPWFRPAFAECYHDGASAIRHAAAAYLARVRQTTPPVIP